ncbi:follistatin-related protein 5-like [Watersipora subatra]|uniref:follistatin-related protein 5-like n=1 Tax=Watersipora subatra TaxID=2589382 RepID=UPI00355C53C5
MGFVITAASRRHKLRHASHLFQQLVEQPEAREEGVWVFEGSDTANDGDVAKIALVQHDLYDELKGRHCVIGEGGTQLCVCAEPETCAPGHKLVCGSDGILYASHCSLHRTACKLGQAIYVDKSGKACFQNDLVDEVVETPHSTSKVMSKKKDLSQTDRYLNDEAKPYKSFSPVCSASQFTEFKHLLRIYHCDRLGMSNCNGRGSSEYRSLISNIFRYYDKDGDGLLTKAELSYAQKADHLENLAEICGLEDLLKYAPRTTAGNALDFTIFSLEFGLNEQEHYRVVYDGETRVTYTIGDGYSSVSLPCSIANASSALWLRNNVEIDFERSSGISLLADGSLYISAANLDHTGNYSCFNFPHSTQHVSHLLIVEVKPVVRSNVIGEALEGVSTALKCHTDGVPKPSVDWKVSSYKLPVDHERYFWQNENTTVNILNPKVQLDSAQYQCVAQSSAGWSHSETTVKVLDKLEYDRVKGNKPSRGLYLVFHGSGYTTYEEQNCYLTHSFYKHSSDFVTNLQASEETLQHLCPFDEDCDWGSAVSVEEKFVYASQPSLERVIVIDVLDNFLPKHVILMQHSVHSLHYLPMTDEVWLLLGNQAEFQTIMTASPASSPKSLQVQSLLPHPSVFDMVDELFVPTLNSFNITSRYAYTSHYDQHGLSRLDTLTKAYDAKMPLANWNCRPINIHHLAIGGLALIECEESSKNLLIDTLNNAIIKQFTPGYLYVSPNTRYIVTLVKPSSLTVHYLHDNATISVLYEHEVQISADQVRFMESKQSSGYDLAVTAADENAVLFMDLKTKKTDLLEGLLSGRANTTATPFTQPLVTSSGDFGDHLMLPSQGALFVVNKRYHMIACEWTNIQNSQLSLWLDV